MVVDTKVLQIKHYKGSICRKFFFFPNKIVRLHSTFDNVIKFVNETQNRLKKKMYISIQANSLSLDSAIRAVSTTKIGIESDCYDG